MQSKWDQKCSPNVKKLKAITGQPPIFLSRLPSYFHSSVTELIFTASSTHNVGLTLLYSHKLSCNLQYRPDNFNLNRESPVWVSPVNTQQPHCPFSKNICAHTGWLKQACVKITLAFPLQVVLAGGKPVAYSLNTTPRAIYTSWHPFYRTTEQLFIWV